MSDELGRALSQTMRAIVAGDVSRGMSSLIDFLASEQPSNPTWRALRKFDFSADAARIQKSLHRHLRDPKMADYTHFYFGLDDLNMPNGKGIEFGCGHEEQDFDYYPGNIPSKGLALVFRECEANVAHYTLGIGFLGLALNQAFAAFGPAANHGGVEWHVIFGFHDGDLFPLGTFSGGKFRLQLPSEYLKRIPKSPPKVKGLSAIWPTPGASTADWFLAAARAADLIADVPSRLNEIDGHLEKTCEHGRPEAALPFVKRLLECESALPQPDDRANLHVLCARVYGALKKRKEALKHLLAARSVGADIKDEYWRNSAYRDVFYAARDAGLARRIGKLTADQERELDLGDAIAAVEHAGAQRSAAKVRAALAALDDILPGMYPLSGRDFMALRNLYQSLGDKDRLKQLKDAPKVKDDPMGWLMEELPIEAGREPTPLNYAIAVLDEVEDEYIQSTDFHDTEMSRLESAMGPLVSSRDAAGIRSLLPRIRKIVGSWRMKSGGKMASSVHRDMAMLLFHADLKDEALARMETAGRCALRERTASSRTSALKSVAESFATMGQWDRAIEFAGQLHDAVKRRLAVAVILVQADRWSELKRHLREIQRPEEASNIAMQIAWDVDKRSSTSSNE
jgi:tetratricopeptide (TPR) repeat protein